MGDWANGLFGCFSNFGICIIATFVPCVTHGQLAEAILQENCLHHAILLACGCGMFTMGTIRAKIREQKGIEGTHLADALILSFCTCCALIQEKAEIDGSGMAMERA